MKEAIVLMNAYEKYDVTSVCEGGGMVIIAHDYVIVLYFRLLFGWGWINMTGIGGRWEAGAIDSFTRRGVEHDSDPNARTCVQSAVQICLCAA